jgi:hypothetical protein
LGFGTEEPLHARMIIEYDLSVQEMDLL